MENLQIRHLANSYDLSRDSRLARAIVEKVNATLDAEERRRGIERLRPGELLLRTHRGPVVIPLRTEEMLRRVMKGERLATVRADILEIARERFKDRYPEASSEMVAKFIRCIYPGQAPRAKPGKGSCWLRPRHARPWPEQDELRTSGAQLAEADAARGLARTGRQPPRPAHRPDTLAELQWMFLASAETISRGIDAYQRINQVILPCPGTILDMGRMLTHKTLIVRLHLQGHSVLEIARATFHHPRSVDAYLRDFDAVLICHLYGMPPPVIASVIHKGTSLVAEYLELIDKYLKDADIMRAHLRERGVKVPLALPRGS
jgi:hypothetical protein